MTINQENFDFVIAADKLRRLSPKEWSDFLAEFNKYSDRQRSKILSSPIDQLPVVQGRAQACHDILQLLAAAQSADQMKEKLNERRTPIPFGQASTRGPY